jgi:two-component system NtrC family sensor kinase
MCEQLNEARAKVRRETEARITALEQLRHEDRLKTAGRLASGLAHELGTPLTRPPLPRAVMLASE